MTAKDELREGLRKRGESWHKWPDEDSTTWQAYSNPHTATESMDGTLIVTGLTPAQAIAATLGESMTDTEKTALERRIYDRCLVRVGQLEAEKAALERRIDELCAEVEALKRDEWSAGFNAGCEAVEAAYEDGKAHYEAENVKLREQVEYMTPIALYAASERERDRMRELGIEVPS